MRDADRDQHQVGACEGQPRVNAGKSAEPWPDRQMAPATTSGPFAGPLLSERIHLGNIEDAMNAHIADKTLPNPTILTPPDTVPGVPLPPKAGG